MTNDSVSQICAQVNEQAKQALHGVAQPLADAARRAESANECYAKEHRTALDVLNGSDVASKEEIQKELSLSGKCRHLRFIAESAERAESELREECVELRSQLADLALTLAEVAGRRADQAA